jgi:hypothetical protein
MTIDEYNKVPDKQKKHLLVDAEKIAECQDDIATYELFKIDTFVVEVSKSVTYKFRKILNVYPLEEIPSKYSESYSRTLSEGLMPIFKLTFLSLPFYLLYYSYS